MTKIMRFKRSLKTTSAINTYSNNNFIGNANLNKNYKYPLNNI